MKNCCKRKVIKSIPKIDRKKMNSDHYMREVFKQLNAQEAVKSLMKSLADK
jgi:hypothetical protein